MRHIVASLGCLRMDQEACASKANAIAHPKRKRIHEWLKNRPGSNRNQISQDLGLYYNSVKYHLDRLVDQNLVIEREGLKDDLVYFRAEDRDLWDPQSTRVLYGRSPTRMIAIYIHENPGSNAPEIADAVGTGLSTVRTHLRTLHKHEIVQKVGRNGENVFQPSEVLEVWMEGPGERYASSVPWDDHALLQNEA